MAEWAKHIFMCHDCFRIHQLIFFLAVAIFFSGCAVVPVEQEIKYSEVNNQHLSDLEQWQLLGRIAMSNEVDSWTANIDWQHETDKDVLNLSGPLGQGAARIILRSDSIMIDQGDGQVGFSKSINEYIKQRLGFLVPLSALRFWVLGLTEPDKPFVRLDEGFSQFSWNIQYLNYIQVGKEWMPAKIKIKNNSAQLKLVIDQWMFND